MICPVLLILLSGTEIITFDCSNFLPWDLFVLLFQVKNKNKIQQLSFSFRERNKLLFCLFQTKLSSFNYLNWELCVDCNFFFLSCCVSYFAASLCVCLFACYVVLFCTRFPFIYSVIGFVFHIFLTNKRKFSH